MFKKLAIIFISLSIAVSMCACQGISDIVSDEESQTETQKSKNINFEMNTITTLNPVVSQDKDTYYISKLIYQSLFALDENLVPYGDLVSKYSISDNGRSVTLTLDSAKFSDGEKVTADDVIFSIDAYKDAGKKSAYYSNVKNIKSYTKKGSSKVRIEFKAAGGSLAMLTFPILPEHKLSGKNLSSTKISFKPLGSGPYKVKSYKKNEKLILKANKYYSGDKPDNILNFKTYRKDADTLNLLDGNLVSFIVSEESDSQKEIGTKNLRNGEYVSNKLVYIGFNTQKSYLKSSDVRKAFAYAIDTEKILKKVYYGSGVITDSIFYPGYLGIEDKGDVYEYSKKKAQDMLEEAGFKDTNKDGYLENKKGKTFTVNIITGDSSLRKKAAEYIADNLESIDIRTSVTRLSDSSYKKKLKKGDYSIYVGEMTFADFYDISEFVGGSLDYTGYDISDIKKKLNQNSKVLENEELKENVNEIKEALNEDLPYYPLFYKTYSYIISDELSEEPAPMFNNIYKGCSSWYSNYEIENDSESDDDSE